MAATETQILNALRNVRDPDVYKDLVSLNQVKDIKICEGNVSVDINTPSPQKDRIRAEVAAAIRAVPGVEEVFVNFSTSLGTATPPGDAAKQPARGGHSHGGGGQAPQGPRGIPGVKHVIAVGAGKGGVGKSTIAVNLAIGLAMLGKKVGLLDGDIYGPSVPTLTGIGPRPPVIDGDRIVPFTVKSGDVSILVMSIGFIVDKEKALIWRGPMAHGAIKQFLEQVNWTGPANNQTELDYLVVDLPPGTGDVALTLAQTVPLTGAVIVATPQEVALADARRAVRMFQQLGVEILGVVENMSYFVCEHGTAYDIFGKGGAQVMSQEMGLPFLGEVPIDVRLRVNSDEGHPFENFVEGGKSSAPLRAIVDMLEKQIAVRMITRPAAKAINLQIS